MTEHSDGWAEPPADGVPVEPTEAGGESGAAPVAFGARQAEELAEVHREVLGLRDLFVRRLKSDQAGEQKFNALYEQLDFARKGLVEDFVAPIVRELVLVIDRLEGMRAHVSADTSEALEGVQVELTEVLNRRGVREVNPVGEPFDPRQHEAVERRTVDDPAEAGQVLEVRRTGYVLEQRIVRPAQVVVGYRPATEG